MKSTFVFVGLVIPVVLVALSASRTALARDEADIRARLAAYAPVRLAADLAGLPPGDRQALVKILTAVEVIDRLYWKQMGPQALEARAALRAATDPVDWLYRDFVAINYGPFDIRRDHERFLDTPTGGPRLPGLAFYPADMTREEFTARIAAHPGLKEEFERLDTVIRRVDGTLVAIPYARLYLDDLEPAAAALREAAALVGSPTLRRYLSLRAEGLVKGEYYPSDRAWLEVRDNPIDIVIGPIETYGDTLLGLKASYEAAALVKDVRGSKALTIYLKHLDGMARALPVDEPYRKPAAGASNVLEIVNVVRFGGDFNAGIKTVAASLPNDERVIQEKGAKKQIYRNVLEAKFDSILRPIADRLLTAKDRALVTREAFVTNVLLHELSHTLGVDYVAGKGELTVRRALGERYAAIEEAKADVVGLFNLRYLRDQELFTVNEMEENDATYLAGLIRSVRFGTADAHGRANAVQLSWLMRDGGVVLDAKKGELTLVPKKFEPALRALAKELLEIEGTGDYERAGRLLESLGKLDEPLHRMLSAIESVPVDVVFTWPL